MTTPTLLLAEDDPFQRQLMTTLLQGKFGYQVVAVENGKQVIAELNKHNHDTFAALFLDVEMPHMGGLEVLETIRYTHAHIPAIMLTSNTKPETVVKAIKLGAYDYLNKPVDSTHVQVTLNNAIRMHTMSCELARVKRNRDGQLGFGDMVGHDVGLAPCIAVGRKAARTQAPVMITGETGTGKELFARAIHGESARAGKPFVAINCGAIPEKLVESILFGHEKGAFTGATERTLGKFREADGGTVFLDELGELPLDAQVKLLRVLQEQEIEPVGASKPVKVDVRIISATNRHLEEQIEQKTFREDLFFRLNVLPIKMPALRERATDVVLLAEYFLLQAATDDGSTLKRLSGDARAYLQQCHWSGNIRELANLMRRASVWCESDHITSVDLKELSPKEKIQTNLPQAVGILAEHSIALHHHSGEHKTLSDIEAEVIRRVLISENNNITHAADKLGVARSTFYRKIQQINLNKDDS